MAVVFLSPNFSVFPDVVTSHLGVFQNFPLFLLNCPQHKFSIELDILHMAYFQLPPVFEFSNLLYVTAAGLRAGNTRYTFVKAGVGPAVVCGGSSWHSVRYSDEYYFSTFVGWARTNLTERWRALFARYFRLWGCWPSGFPINTTRIITKSGDWHQSGFGPGYGYPSKIQNRRKQRVCFIYKESVEVPGMGMGESYTGLLGKIHTARWLLVKRP